MAGIRLGFKCEDCGNTKSFFRTFAGSVNFETEDEMLSKDGDFLDWEGEISCDKCYSENVEQIELEEKEREG